MLACDRPARLDTAGQDFATGCHDAVEDARLAHVEQDHRMQIAITRVEQVGDRQVVALADLDHLGQDLGQPRARYHRVVQIVIRRDAAHRAGGTLARRPEACAFLGGRRQTNFERTGSAADLVDDGRLAVHLLDQAVYLDEQHRACFGRIAGLERGFNSRNGEPIHHLERRRHQAAADQVGDRRACRLDRRKQGHGRAHRLWQRHQPHCCFGDDAQGSLGTDEGAGLCVVHVDGRRAHHIDARRRKS